MDFSEWLNYGIANDFCGPAVCYTHDGVPFTEKEEFALIEEDDDRCIHIIRPYGGDSELKREVEFNHSPSKWRKNG